MASHSLPPRLLHGARLQLPKGSTIRHHTDPLRLLVARPGSRPLHEDRPDTLELAVQPLLHAERLVDGIQRLRAGPTLGRRSESTQGLRLVVRPVTTVEEAVEPLSFAASVYTSRTLSIFSGVYIKLVFTIPNNL